MASDTMNGVVSEVNNWLSGQAAARQRSIHVHQGLARRDGRWLYLPVHLYKAVDGADFARTLQDLEDSWNEQDPEPEVRLLLIPAAD